MTYTLINLVLTCELQASALTLFSLEVVEGGGAQSAHQTLRLFLILSFFPKHTKKEKREELMNLRKLKCIEN